MDGLQETMERIRTSILTNSSQNQQEKNLTIPTLCKKCNDTEFVLNPDTNKYRPCECREFNLYKRILKSSGVSEEFRKIGFKEFDAYNEPMKLIKEIAIGYVKNFETFEHLRENSIAFLGSPGSGKTHLSISIANNLMSKNIGVMYMPYREIVTKIKQNINNDEEYGRLVNPYKNARVLLVDDLFKGKVTESDVNIMFDILNHRYLNHSPIIVSSEYTQKDMLNFDEAIGSRIIQMCRGRISEIKGLEYNYRLRG